MFDRKPHNPTGAKPRSASRCVISAFLVKLSRHLALIACLMIVGGATGRFAESQLGIFFLVLAAAALHSIGRGLQHRSRSAPPLSRFDP
jgi:hypothetical protein